LQSGIPMNALDLIKEDHKRLKKLLKETLEAEGSQREDRMDRTRRRASSSRKPAPSSIMTSSSGSASGWKR